MIPLRPVAKIVSAAHHAQIPPPPSCRCPQDGSQCALSAPPRQSRAAITTPPPPEQHERRHHLFARHHHRTDPLSRPDCPATPPGHATAFVRDAAPRAADDVLPLPDATAAAPFRYVQIYAYCRHAAASATPCRCFFLPMMLMPMPLAAFAHHTSLRLHQPVTFLISRHHRQRCSAAAYVRRPAAPTPRQAHADQHAARNVYARARNVERCEVR